MKRRDLAARFWEKVAEVGGPGCWEWKAARHGRRKCQYGSIGTGDRRTAQAHRVSWVMAYGPTADLVLHSCDNPACVRPSHLFLGTYLDNIADRVRKGRSSGGRNGGRRVACCI